MKAWEDKEYVEAIKPIKKKISEYCNIDNKTKDIYIELYNEYIEKENVNIYELRDKGDYESMLHCLYCNNLIDKFKKFMVQYLKNNYTENSYIVYFILNREINACKIGITKGDPIKRLKSLQTGNSSKLELIAYVEDVSFKIEKELHKIFEEFRLNGEWFEYSSKKSNGDSVECFINRLISMFDFDIEQALNEFSKSYNIILTDREMKEIETLVNEYSDNNRMSENISISFYLAKHNGDIK